MVYSEAAERAIRSEAEIWRYGNVESARRSYDRHVEWARKLTADQRELHKWGAWHANDLLMMAAIGQVQREAARS
jgi:hypothetical protein